MNEMRRRVGVCTFGVILSKHIAIRLFPTATRSKMNSGILEFTAHAVGLRCNGRHLKQIIDLHLAERTVPRVKNWTTGE